MRIETLPIIITDSRLIYEDVILLNQCIYNQLLALYTPELPFPYHEYLKDEFDEFFYRVFTEMDRTCERLVYHGHYDAFTYVTEKRKLDNNHLFDMLYRGMDIYFNTDELYALITTYRVQWIHHMKGVLIDDG